MSDAHNYSFFGQKTGMILQSSSKHDSFIFFRVIKKKDNETWEKPSSGEGKSVKFSLEEMVLILQVLNKEVTMWSSYHKYKENNTKITFQWQQEEEGQQSLWINIGEYPKMLNYSQSEILRLLLIHILNEKIKYATTSSSNKSTGVKNNIASIEKTHTNEPQIHNRVVSQNLNKNSNTKKASDKINVAGSIKGETEKALLVTFSNGKDVWIPKSVIHSKFNQAQDIEQSFLIDKWIFEKNKIPA